MFYRVKKTAAANGIKKREASSAKRTSLSKMDNRGRFCKKTASKRGPHRKQDEVEDKMIFTEQ